MSKTNYRKRTPNKTNDFLEELILMQYGEYTKDPISEDDGGFEVIEIDATAKGLTIPAGPGIIDDVAVGSATIMCEGGDGILVRYKQNGTNPAQDEGHFLHAGDILEVGREQLETIKFTSGQADVTSKLQVQYYTSLELDLNN